MEIDAVLLTGGASSRMGGADKAQLQVDGKSLSARIAEELGSVCGTVTVCGRTPLAGYRFLSDQAEYAGPLAALARFRPTKPLVFVASCDLPRFKGELVSHLEARIGSFQAAIPVLEGRDQPLCALYKAEAFSVAETRVSEGERRVMSWIKSLTVVRVEDLPDPEWVRNVNTPEELHNARRG